MMIPFLSMVFAEINFGTIFWASVLVPLLDLSMEEVGKNYNILRKLCT